MSLCQKRFYVISNTEGISLVKVTEKVDKLVNSKEACFIYDNDYGYEILIFLPKKFKNQQTNRLIHDVETFDRDTAIQYAVRVDPVSNFIWKKTKSQQKMNLKK